MLRSCTYWLDFSPEPLVLFKAEPPSLWYIRLGVPLSGPRRVDTEIESHRRYRVTISLLVSLHELTSARRYQYFSAGRISIAPPRRAAGTRAATLIAASTFSASRMKYPPTAPRTST